MMIQAGYAIKSERERKGITQEELCENICSVSTLSRIEHGEKFPGRDRIISLLEKLGINTDYVVEYETAEEMEFAKEEEKIRDGIIKKDYKEVRDACDELKKKYRINPLRNQRLLIYECICIIYNKDYSFESDTEVSTEKKILEAIKITYPDYNEKSILRRMLTDTEVRAINLHACVKYRNGQLISAIRILNNLIDALDRANDITEFRNNLYPMLFCNLSKWYIKLERYMEAGDAIEKGINLCESTGRYRTLPLFICYRAYVKRCEGKTDDEVRNEYLKAYVLFNSMGQHSEAEKLRIFLKNVLDWDIGSYIQ